MVHLFDPENANIFTNIGLYGSTLYEIIEENLGEGNVTVDAWHFTFDCGAPPAPPNITNKPRLEFDTTNNRPVLTWGEDKEHVVNVTLPNAISEFLARLPLLFRWSINGTTQ